MKQQHTAKDTQKSTWSSDTGPAGLAGNRRPVEELQADLPGLAHLLRQPVENPGTMQWRFADEKIRAGIRCTELTAQEKTQARADLRRFSDRRGWTWVQWMLLGLATAIVAAGAYWASTTGGLGESVPAAQLQATVEIHRA
jgi:hypothetical protein